MRRALLVCAISVGLLIGIAWPTTAIGLTQVTLTCSDGTTSTMVVDTDTLTGLTLAIQAMIDYPAGLVCTMAQVPLPGIVHLGGIALASPGTNPFIVGGGRWVVPCDTIFPPPPPCPTCTGSIEGPVFARAPGAYLAVLSASTQTVFVNIAVNFHQRDDGSFFGTLNETIPANQSCGTIVVGETHFTSKPEPSPPGCFGIDATDLTGRTAHTVSNVTQTSGQQPFPNGSGLTTSAGFLNVGDLVHFSFIDNGNPGQGTDDMLQGPPAPNDSTCVQDPNTKVVTATGTRPAFHLTNGNVTLHPKP
jgi:hypothetical protein